ncbi:MAG: DUF4430 domain-containing protein [Clostridia bacterium]|nr:DUF4430 domain-containing protein [Clostridia bacterium]
MRNRIIIFLLAILLLCQGVVPAMAEEADTKVFVTISDDQGALVLTHKEITVSDQDQDGTLTIHDALYCAHQQYKPGGYGTESTQWGLSLMKLWGIETGGSCGYYLNNVLPANLLAPAKNGDSVKAFIYTDTATFSDTFSYFNYDTATGKIGDPIRLTLYALGFDPVTFAPTTSRVAGARILIDGVDSGIVTDETGTCTVTITKNCIISATSETMTLVPPVCRVTCRQTVVSDEDMKDVGGISEWYVFSMQGEDSLYAQALVKALQEDTITKNPVTRQKIALAGLSLLNPEEHPEFAAYLEDVTMDTIGELGIMSWVFGLHLLTNKPRSNFRTEDVIDTILSMQQENGSWAVVGSTPDVDATAMVLCALAPHKYQDGVRAAIDLALSFLEQAQQPDGSFKNYGVSNAESCAQVGMALVCLNVPRDDLRFIKNGRTVWDALETFYTEDGYRHTLDGDVNSMATAQSVCAVETYRTGRSPFRVASRYTQAQADPKSGSYKIPVTVVLTALAVCILIVLYIRKKRALRHFLPVILVWVLALVLVWTVQIQSPGEYEADILHKENPIGSVVLSVEGQQEGAFSIEAGDTVLEVLRMAGVKWNLPMVISTTGYVSEIDGLAEFDKGPLSGWKYKVNGSFPSVGADDYELSPGDRVEWVFVTSP